MSDELNELLELARNHVWTEEEKREQIISFAYGNVALSNPAIKREDIEKAYEELYGHDQTNL